MPEAPTTVEVYAVFVVFVRLGAALAVLPGFNSGYVGMRIRLLIALALAALVGPALGSLVPPMPATPSGLALLLAGEATIGIFLGLVPRIAFAALQTAGTFTSYYASFTNALVQDPVAEQQSSTLTGFFSTFGLVLVFVTDLHHVMLRAIVESYAVFEPGRPPPLGEFCRSLLASVADGFLLAVQLTAPFLVVSLVTNVGLGLLGRLMPQLQVFYFGLPIQISLHLWVMMLTISGMMLVFLNWFAETLGATG